MDVYVNPMMHTRNQFQYFGHKALVKIAASLSREKRVHLLEMVL